MLLGAIADDFTGATDLCSMLVRGGMRTVQLIGVPQTNDRVPEADAVVVKDPRTGWFLDVAISTFSRREHLGAPPFLFLGADWRSTSQSC